MAYWVEVHCDVNSEGPPDPGRLEPYCYSNNGSSSGVMIANESAAKASSIASRVARSRGWVRRRKGWVCPNCKKMPRVPK